MEKFKSLSEKRLIVECEVNGKKAPFLLDTGASIPLIAADRIKKYDLKKGRLYPGTIVGAGGNIANVFYCNTFAYIKGRTLAQFLLTDISAIRESIRRETGIEVLGVISLPQMKMAGISIDCNDNLIIME